MGSSCDKCASCCPCAVDRVCHVCTTDYGGAGYYRCLPKADFIIPLSTCLTVAGSAVMLYAIYYSWKKSEKFKTANPGQSNMQAIDDLRMCYMYGIGFFSVLACVMGWIGFAFLPWFINSCSDCTAVDITFWSMCAVTTIITVGLCFSYCGTPREVVLQQQPTTVVYMQGGGYIQQPYMMQQPTMQMAPMYAQQPIYQQPMGGMGGLGMGQVTHAVNQVGHAVNNIGSTNPQPVMATASAPSEGVPHSTNG